MREYILLLFPLLLLFTCSDNEKSISLIGTKWKSPKSDSGYVPIETMEFTSKSSAVWTIVYNGYGDIDINEEYLMTYKISGIKLKLSNVKNHDNVEAFINLDTNTITLNNRLFIKQD